MKYWKDGFYLEQIEGSVKITDEYWQELLEEQSQGKQITTREDGYPIAMAYEITSEMLEKQARSRRDALLKETVDSLNPMRWEALTELQKDDWRIYRQALLDVPQQEGFPVNVVWPIHPWEEEVING